MNNPFTRLLSLLMVFVLAFSMFPTAMAAEIDTPLISTDPLPEEWQRISDSLPAPIEGYDPNDPDNPYPYGVPVDTFYPEEALAADPYGVSLMALDQSYIPDEMQDNAILRALEYTGYDVQYLKDNGYLYVQQYTGSSILNYAPNVLSDIGYWESGACPNGDETIKDSTGFSFFEDELGITGCLDKYSVSEFSCESPFDYKNHTRLYISESTPIPDMHDPDYIPAVAKEIVQLIKATHGHTAVLFTSYKTLNTVYDLVAGELNSYPLIKMSRSNKNAITQFKESGNGVLFASGSMWEGVDCAGDILPSVIIVRLKFPLRTQAMEFKKRACGNTKEFVQRYAVPQMIIKLRQGVGRLIRTETDTGVLAILDARSDKNGAYRSRVLKALRKYPLVSSVQEVASFIDSVKDESYKKEVPHE